MAKQTSLYYRHKLLLALVEVFGGRLDGLRMQKYLFLFIKENACDYYDFVPYKFGGFSFVSYEDKRTLTRRGILKDTDDWQLVSDESYLAQIEQQDAEALRTLKTKYGDKTKNELIRIIYDSYPYYAIHSERSGQYMDPRKVAEYKSRDDSYVLFTIGYEGRSFDHYLNCLIEHNVKLLCDVRKNPFSHKYGFKKQTLTKICPEVGIAYHHIPALGIELAKRKNIQSPAVREKVFNEYKNTTLIEQRAALTELYDIFKQHKRIALTCFERQPQDCHRHLVADALSQLPSWKYEIKHI